MMTKDDFDYLRAQVCAHGLILRGLFARWAQQDDPNDPEESAFLMMEAMISSMHNVGFDTNSEELAMLHLVEDQLREFAEMVAIKLAGIEAIRDPSLDND